ncbi:MAG: DUF1501 domain-containing protein [Planctomycetes bacterium]|nr:DUF1501 domain-containing protein [Planctomycetota bacterium]
MLTVNAREGSRHCDGMTRREWLRIGALGVGALTLPGLLATEAQASGRRARARSVIILFLSGGPSHLDMWDLKPNAPEEIRGTFRPAPSRVPGIQICEHMPMTSAVMDKCAIIRSMQHASGNHPAAGYWMMIGSPMTRPAPQIVTMSREDRPHPGAVAAQLLPPLAGRASDGRTRPANMPGWVMVPEAISPVGPERPGQHAGFFGAAFDPYRVNSDPNSDNYSAGALAPNPDADANRIDVRRALLREVNQAARHLDATAPAQALDPYYARAFDLVSSPVAQRAFDINAEPAAMRERYGRHIFGQSALLARRLVEAGVRLVHVNWVRHDNGFGGQGYDSHRDHLTWARTELLPPTDRAFAALVSDLADRRLLDSTLIVLMGEFGRTPRFNVNGGRDHWPNCFSLMLAGGGIRGGQVVGASDRIGGLPTTNPVRPQDLTATIYDLLGIDPHTTVYDLQRRPLPLVEGEPLRGMYA